MADLLGIVAIVVFYLLILAVGIWAGRKSDASKNADGQQTEEVMLAGRNIGTLVGIFTMTGERRLVGGGWWAAAGGAHANCRLLQRLGSAAPT